MSLLGSVSQYFEKQNIYPEVILKELSDNRDTFFDRKILVERLKSDYKKYGRIIIAYDFDDTVKPSNPNYDCSSVVKLLQLCSKLNDIEMICFTARRMTDQIKEVEQILDSLNIRHDAINDDCYRIKNEIDKNCESKVMYSIFLDDRAGLDSAFYTLLEFLKFYFQLPAISE